MDKSDLKRIVKDLLKEELELEVQRYSDYDGAGYKIIVKFDSEEITSDTIMTERNDYY